MCGTQRLWRSTPSVSGLSGEVLVVDIAAYDRVTGASYAPLSCQREFEHRMETLKAPTAIPLLAVTSTPGREPDKISQKPVPIAVHLGSFEPSGR